MTHKKEICQTGAVRVFPVKRDQLLLFAVTCDCKKLKAINCE